MFRLLRGRGERLALLHDIHGVELHGARGGALVMDGAVENRQRFAGAVNLFGLTIQGQPEVTLHDLRHDDARMRMAAGLEPGCDFHRRIDDLEIGARHIRLLQYRSLDRRGRDLRRQRRRKSERYDGRGNEDVLSHRFLPGAQIIGCWPAIVPSRRCTPAPRAYLWGPWPGAAHES